MGMGALGENFPSIPRLFRLTAGHLHDIRGKESRKTAKTTRKGAPMDKRKTERILRILISSLLGALWVATGVAFILGTVAIYRSGAAPYTPKSIAEGFGKIAPLCFSTLAATAVCGVLSLLFPSAASAHGRHLPSLLRRQRRRTGKRDEAESRRRALLALPFFAVILGSLIFSVVEFVLAASLWGRFSSTAADALSHDVAAQILVLLPPIALSLAAAALYQILARPSVERETKTLAALPTVAEEPPRPSRKLLIARTAVLTAAVIFLILGVANGGALDVIGKAVRICAECIGLG